MHNMDELLQKQLEALEKGADPETVLAKHPDENGENNQLMRLATAIRKLPHPALPAEKALKQRQQLVTAGRQQAISSPRRFEWGSLGWLIAPSLAGAALLFMVGLVWLMAMGAWLLGPRSARMATLMDVSGHIEVAAAGQEADWRAVTNGEQVRAGQRIRTQAASSATLLFFDGSRTMIGPNADLTLSKVSGGWGKVLIVSLTQEAGKTSSSVVPLRGARSTFSVNTPSGAVSVRGTTFSVAVDPHGRARFAVDSGKVLVSRGGAEVTLLAGQAVASGPDETLESPAYQFAVQGELSAGGLPVPVEGSTWIVAGVPFGVTTETVITGDPQLGDILLVEGRILEENLWVADSIEPVEAEENTATFTGILEGMEDPVWQVGGQAILVDEQTEKGEGLEMDRAVRVTIIVLEDGSWLAARIELLEETPVEPTPTPTHTADPGAQPSLSFDPDELEVTGCDASVNFTGRLFNTGTPPDDYAADVVLGYELINGAEYVEAVILTPGDWERIEAGEQVDFNIAVALKPSWMTTPSGAEVKVRVFIASETNRPGHHLGRLTVTIVSTCGEEPTATPTPTQTATPTETPTATPTETPTVTPTPTVTDTETITPTPEDTTTPVPGDGFCTGANPHPTGMTLAQRYGVPYEEIMYWFCQGFGFGEIDLAYSLSRQTGVPVEQIFQMKSSGMGWGQIKQQLLGSPSHHRKPKKNR